MSILIGVLALQGDVREHMQAIARAGGEAITVRTVEELARVDGLIIPGGESTTVGKLLVRFGLIDPVIAFAAAGKPIYGTCTGMILLADDIEGSEQPRIGAMRVTVRRNAFGRQVDSFEDHLTVIGIEGGPVHTIFIRAPFITAVGTEVDVLAEYQGHPVLIRQGHLLASAFHPELTQDTRIHEYFLAMVREAQG